jgi:hypothetical protein
MAFQNTANSISVVSLPKGFERFGDVMGYGNYHNIFRVGRYAGPGFGCSLSSGSRPIPCRIFGGASPMHKPVWAQEEGAKYTFNHDTVAEYNLQMRSDWFPLTSSKERIN